MKIYIYTDIYIYICKLVSLSLIKGGWKLKQTFLVDLGPTLPKIKH